MLLDPILFVEFGTADGYAITIPNNEISTLNFFDISLHFMYVDGTLKKVYTCEGYEIKILNNVKHNVCKGMDIVGALTFNDFAKKHKVSNATVVFANTNEWLVLLPQRKKNIIVDDDSILISCNPKISIVRN